MIKKISLRVRAGLMSVIVSGAANAGETCQNTGETVIYVECDDGKIYTYPDSLWGEEQAGARVTWELAWGHSCNMYYGGMGMTQASAFGRTMLSYKSEDAGACWYCGVFGDLFDAINKLCSTLFNKMGKAFITLMGVGILFFLLFRVGKMVTSLQEVDLMQFLNDLLKPLGRAIVAMALLITSTSMSDTIFSMLINPVFNVSLTMGYEIMDTTLKDQPYEIKTGDASLDSGVSYSWSPTACSMTWMTSEERDTGSDGKKMVLTRGEKSMLTCWMRQIAGSFIVGIAMGGSLMEAGTSGVTLFTSPSLFLCGFFIWLSFYSLYLMFPFKIIDAFVRLAFVLALMPLWIILWVFPATVQYTKKAWDMFVSACLLFVVMSVMISVAITLMNKSIPEADRQGLITCLLLDMNDAAATWVAFGTGAFTRVVGFAAIGMALLNAAGTLANTFAGSMGDLGVGQGAFSTLQRGAIAAAGLGVLGAKAGVATTGAAARGVGKLAGKAQDYLGNKRGWSTAGGAIPTKLDRFKRMMTTPIGFSRSPAPAAGYDPARLGESFGRMVPGSGDRVQNQLNAEMARVRGMVASNDNAGLQRWVSTGSAEEQRIKADMVQEMRRTNKKDATGARTGGQPKADDLQALRDIRAAQERKRNILSGQDKNAEARRIQSDRENQLSAAERQQLRDYDRLHREGERDARARMSSLESMVRMSDSDYQTRRDALFATAAERAAADKFRDLYNRNGGVITDSAREGVVSDLADAHAGSLSTKLSAVYKDTQAMSHLNDSAEALQTAKDLATNLDTINTIVAQSGSQEALNEALQNATWTFSGDSAREGVYQAQMSNMAQQIYEARMSGAEENLRNVMRNNVSGVLQSYGEMSESDSTRLAQLFTKESAHGVMVGTAAAAAAGRPVVTMSGTVGSFLSQENLNDA